ncbi:MAG: hypothetical protein HQ591_10965 [candidate division Zixibacteria bacterium]|nr:hypothetical protein [Candidatus Tariuqbacter arcticus]
MQSILIFAAFPGEVKGVIRKLRLVRAPARDGLKCFSGEFDEMKIHLVLTGMGMSRSHNAAVKCLRQFQVDLVLNIGAAGSLMDNIKPKSIFIPTSVVSERNRPIFCDADYSKLFKNICRNMEWDFQQGRLFTSIKAVNSVSAKREINGRYEAQAVDMEAYPQALMATEKGIPFACIKGISDTAAYFPLIQYLLNVGDISRKMGELVFESLECL